MRNAERGARCAGGPAPRIFHGEECGVLLNAGAGVHKVTPRADQLRGDDALSRPRITTVPAIAVSSAITTRLHLDEGVGVGRATPASPAVYESRRA